MKFKIAIALLFGIVLIALIGYIWLSDNIIPLPQGSNSNIGQPPLSQNNGRCLTADEKSSYEQPDVYANNVTIVVKNKKTGIEEWRNVYNIPSGDSWYTSVENCHFYLMQEFNADHNPKLLTYTLANYSFEVRRFNYFDNSASSSVVVVLASDKTGKDIDFVGTYSRAFKIDPSEKYITLERGNLGDANYALVIKDINTGEDAYVLALKDILKDHPNAAGSFSIGEWVQRPDGVYIDGDIYDGSHWTAFYYIKRDTWETKIYDTPADYLAGVERSAPSFAPLLAYTNVIDWTGSNLTDEAILDQQIAAGLQKHLIVADLRTGATTTIATVPIVKGHKYDPTWLDDDRLQYTMPDGTKHIYNIRP